jgi:hypothetical protein
MTFDRTRLQVVLILLRRDDLTRLLLLRREWLLRVRIVVRISRLRTLLVRRLLRDLIRLLGGSLRSDLGSDGGLAMERTTKRRESVTEIICTRLDSACMGLRDIQSVRVGILSCGRACLSSSVVCRRTRRSATYDGYCFSHLRLFDTRSALLFHCQLFHTIPMATPRPIPYKNSFFTS